MQRYIVIFSDMLFDFNVLDGESFNVPPLASKIVEQDWNDMVTAAGGETNLLTNLGIVYDLRDGQ